MVVKDSDIWQELAKVYKVALDDIFDRASNTQKESTRPVITAISKRALIDGQNYLEMLGKEPQWPNR